MPHIFRHLIIIIENVRLGDTNLRSVHFTEAIEDPRAAVDLDGLAVFFLIQKAGYGFVIYFHGFRFFYLMDIGQNQHCIEFSFEDYIFWIFIATHPFERGLPDFAVAGDLREFDLAYQFRP